MRSAPTFACILSGLQLVAALGCEPVRDEASPGGLAGQGPMREPKGDAGDLATPAGVDAASVVATRAGPEAGAGPPRQVPRSASAGHGGMGSGFVGDVPARAAASGKVPCGSSEFSVGPCGGRSGRADQPPSAGAPADPRDASVPAPEDEAQPEPNQTAQRAAEDAAYASGCEVGPIPDALRAGYELDPFYTRYASAYGIPVLGSDQPAQHAIELACLLVNEMLSEREDVRSALVTDKVTFAIVATSERTTDIPEYRDLPEYYDTRARGLGGHTGLCAEESILCDRSSDAWRGESICVHEYSHTIAIYGLFAVDTTFEDRLAAAFAQATDAGLWRNTFAAQDAQEYWAEGVQDWYDTNLEADPPDGVHGPVNTRQELERYDATLYGLIDELLPLETRWPDCYRHQP